MSDIGYIFAKAFTLGYETGRKYALFPATEPAEVSSNICTERNSSTPVDEGRESGGQMDRYTCIPAPAEPAEEELGLPYCRAPEDGWECTEPADHDGRHVATNRKNGSVYHSWPAEEKTKAEELQEELEDLTVVYEAAATVRDEAVSLSYWLAQQLGEHVDDAYDRGETLTDTVQRLIEHIRPNRGKAKTVTAPVEEETKAEDYCCHPKCRFTDWGGINRKHERGDDCPIVPMPASSPVAPAPTETGPWPSLNDVPPTVRKVKDAKAGFPWVRREGSSEWLGCDGSYTACRAGHPESAPFVAAKEKS